MSKGTLGRSILHFLRCIVRITGENWDVAVLDELRRVPPPCEGEASHSERHCHVLRRIIASIGDSVHRFFQQAIIPMRRVIETGDPVHLYLDWMATYYLTMYDLFSGKPFAALPGWTVCLRELTRAASSHRPLIVVTFQIGFPLIGPAAFAEATGCPSTVLMHSQHQAAIEFIQKTGDGVGVQTLENASIAELLRPLHAGNAILANVDMAYDGTRCCDVSFLDGTLRMPAGFIRLGEHAGAVAQAMAIVHSGEGVMAHCSVPIMLEWRRSQQVLEEIASFFEPLVRQLPAQWMGWGNLRWRTCR